MSQSVEIPVHMLQHLEYLRGLYLEGPHLGNVYLEDTALLSYLSSHPISKNDKFQAELSRLGMRFAGIYLNAARHAQENPPKLEQFDSYGQRIDKLHLSYGWKQLGKYCAEDGIVSLAYEYDRFNLKKHQRFGQLIVLYLFQASSGLYGCPLAMTDGAAYTLKDMDRVKKTNLEEAYQHLISRTNLWTSGQWVTEKKGGSDVSMTETVAVASDNGNYNLYGYKWFTSATDSQTSLTLAKIIPKNTKPTQELLENTKVSLFILKLRKEDGKLNNMEIVRLKDKLGTYQLPTAELLLKGSEASLISEPGKGIKMISKMLNVTRIYNAATAVGIMRRMVALARDYADRRVIGKIKLSYLPLQVRVLAHMYVTHRANLIFYLKISYLFSNYHAGIINYDDANILRMMTPVLKLFTAKYALQVVTEGVESFGGMGYIEGTMIPSYLRDAQVLTIWEGTTNVLCHDFVRALLKQTNKVKPIDSLVKFFISSFEHIGSGEVKDKTFIYTNKYVVLSYLALIKELYKNVQTMFVGSFGYLRNYCFGLARIYIAVLLQLQALASMRKNDIEISIRWAKRVLYAAYHFSKEMDRRIGLDLDYANQPRGVGNHDKQGNLRPRL